MVIWITGRSEAGKTTLANHLAKLFRWRGQPVLILDGDAVRKQYHPPLGFSDEDRRKHIMNVSRMAADAEKRGEVVIISLVSPKREWREEARRMFKESVLIYLPGGFLWPGTSFEDPKDEPVYMRGDG